MLSAGLAPDLPQAGRPGRRLRLFFSRLCGATSVEKVSVRVLSDADDDTLVKAVAEGSREAFGLLMSRHVDRAYALALRILGRASDAEDVVQDSFTRLWPHADRWRPGEARFSTWLYRVVVNRCLDLKRRHVPVALDSVAEPEDPAEDAFSRLARLERESRLRQAIDELPDRQRAALALTVTLELSQAEAAASLDISVKALESLLVRARRTLRARLGTLSEETGPGRAEQGMKKEKADA